MKNLLAALLIFMLCVLVISFLPFTQIAYNISLVSHVRK